MELAIITDIESGEHVIGEWRNIDVDGPLTMPVDAIIGDPTTSTINDTKIVYSTIDADRTGYIDGEGKLYVNNSLSDQKGEDGMSDQDAAAFAGKIINE
jgi:hypothetical protein